MQGASLIQSVRGPVLLITLGVLFIIHQSTAFDFGRTFPVLLIVFGLFKLAERAVDRNVPETVGVPPYANPAYTNPPYTASSYQPYGNPPYPVSPYPGSPEPQPAAPPSTATQPSHSDPGPSAPSSGNPTGGAQ